MASPLRGEVEVVIDGRPRALRLTLGALAELETTLEADSLLGLAERLEGRGLRARDVLAVFAAALRAAGEPADETALSEMVVDGGAAGAARAAARLLSAAFTGRAE